MAEKQPQQYCSDAHATHGVLPPMTSKMIIDMKVNREGNILLFHDTPLAGTLEWIEYDQHCNQVVLVYDDGRLQHVGLKIPGDIGTRLLHAQQAATVYKKNGEVQLDDAQMVAVMVRNDVFE